MKPETKWKGRPLSEYTKEELIKIVEEMGALQFVREVNNKKYKDFIESTMGSMGKKKNKQSMPKVVACGAFPCICGICNEGVYD